MIENLKDKIDQDIEKVAEALLELGMDRVDDVYFELLDKDNPIESALSDPQTGAPDYEFPTKFAVILFPKLISYEDKTEVWIACQVHVENDLKGTAKMIKEFMNNIKFKPFKDEDSLLEMFKVDYSFAELYIRFYVNPDYPDGYWRNHAL